MDEDGDIDGDGDNDEDDRIGDDSHSDENDRIADADRIADVAEVPADSTLLFTVRDGLDEREAVLTETDTGEITAFENYCQHWTDVRLDKGSGATKRDGELVCGKHGALFDDDSGCCTHGPCEGAVLQRVEIAVADGAVYLTDDDYEFVELGSTMEYDLSSDRSLGL